MEAPVTSQKQDVSDSDIRQTVRQTVRPLVELFYEGLTEEQWASLRAGQPDNMTVIMLADLLLDIISSLSRAFLMLLKSPEEVTEEDIRDSLKDAIPECFSTPLGIRNSAQSILSSESLVDIISTDVTSSLNNSISGLSQRVTPPNRLNTMIQCACKLLKRFVNKMKPKFTCLPQKKVSPTTSQEEPAASDTDRLKSLEKKMTEEVDSIIDPLSHSMTDSEYRTLKDQCKRQIQDITKTLETSMKKESRIINKVTEFLAKCFAKAWILRILAQLKQKFQRKHTEENKEAIPSLVCDIDKMLKDQEAALVAETKMSPSQVILTETLSNFLYRHVSSDPNVIHTTRLRNQYQADMFANILSKVHSFLSLVSWWREFQAFHHSKRVTEAIEGTETAPIKPSGTDKMVDKQDRTPVGQAWMPDEQDRTLVEQDRTLDEQYAAEFREYNKAATEVFVEKLVSRVFRKSKVDCAPEAVDIIENLSEKTWAAVEDVKFVTTPKTFTNLDKQLYKHLCRKRGGEHMVLAHLVAQHPALTQDISTYVRNHLTKPAKKNIFQRFFSAVRNTLFKCRVG